MKCPRSCKLIPARVITPFVWQNFNEFLIELFYLPLFADFKIEILDEVN